jgi:hypothetical protein
MTGSLPAASGLIGYRRAGHGLPGRLALRRPGRTLGSSHVFKDVDSIELGV